MKKIMGWIIDACCILAGIVLVGALGMVLLGLKPAVVVSGSMEPTIKTGSLILIDTNYQSPSAQDIVAFRTGGALVTHRLVRETEDGWITKGDANSAEDPWKIRETNMIGKTVFWIPVLGYLIGKGGSFSHGKEKLAFAHSPSP